MHIELAHELHQRKQQGEICLVDRSPATMWSYQVRASGLPEDFARPVIEKSFQLLAPDVLIIYLTSLHILKSRLNGRAEGNDDFFQNKQDSYHEWTIIGYTEAARMWGGQTVDATPGIDVVHQQTMTLIRPVLPERKQ
jgi:thymidylate kinase